jgi:hypothetical protein
MPDYTGDYVNGFRFEPAALPPPMTLAEIHAMLGRIEANKKRIACATDVFEQVRDAVYGAGYGIYFKVVECSWLEDGQVVLMPSEAEEQAGLQRSGHTALNEIVERWVREQRAADEFRHRYDAAVYQPRLLSAVITDI